MNLKELYTKVKAVFDAPPVALAAPVAPVAPVAPADTSSATVYTLQDGTQIAIQQAGATPAPGDTVTVAGAPAPEGMMVLQDGSAITCDATGTITLFTPVGGTPVTADVPGADAAAKPPVPGAPVIPAKSPIPGMPGKSGYSDADRAALLAAFDTVGADDGGGMLAVLITCVKALMQSEFGWQIDQAKRLTDTNAAIMLYQTTLQASSQKFAAQEATIAQLKATLAGMFEILEKVVELPTASPKTVTSARKDEIEEAKKKTQDKFVKMAESLKTVKEQATT